MIAVTDKLAWYVARSSGIVAWATVTASILWGLTLSSRLVRKRGVPAWLLDLHRYLGTLSLVFVVVHLNPRLRCGIAPRCVLLSWAQISFVQGQGGQAKLRSSVRNQPTAAVMGSVPAQQSCGAATEHGRRAVFCRPSRGLIFLPPWPTARAVGYSLAPLQGGTPGRIDSRYPLPVRWGDGWRAGRCGIDF